MTYVNTDIACCGISELCEIYQSESPEDIMECLYNDGYSSSIFFTDISRTKYKHGNDLEKYIKKHRLGRVTRLPTFVNMNTGNRVRMYFWIASDNLLTHVRKVYEERNPPEAFDD